MCQNCDEGDESIFFWFVNSSVKYQASVPSWTGQGSLIDSSLSISFVWHVRPDMSEQWKTAANIWSLKACRAARQGFSAWENVPAERGKVFPPGKMFLRSAARFSRPGKCSRGARQGFPAWENVPAQRGKLFPLGKTFPTSAARFSRLGKCSSETERGFPIDSTLNISFVCPVRSHEMVTVNNQDSILVLENAASEELKMPICVGRLPIF